MAETMVVLEKAITNKQKVKFNYDGLTRIVDPYLIGDSEKWNIVLRGYQTGGQSNSDIPAWKLFKLEKMIQLEIINEKFEKRSDYNPNDKDMKRIIFKL